MDVELYSFDIFDTLITRNTISPLGIFLLLQDKIKSDRHFDILPDDFVNNFCQYRKNAELRCRGINNTNYNFKEITLDDIYNNLMENHSIENEFIEKIKLLEIELELKSVQPIQKNIKNLKKILENSKQVILISDMYLPINVIKNMLINIDTVFEKVKIYLSSELGYTKCHGSLFEYIHDIEKIEYRKWIHIGDNINSDYNIPKKLGIQARLYKANKLNKYETDILKKYSNNSYIQLLLGCSKNILNNNSNINYLIGASIGGPLLYSYVSWILKTSMQKNIKNLYFIARDGYILKQIADIFITKEKLNIKSHYLYGSRKAWRLPALTIENQDLYKQFIKAAMFSPSKLASTLGLSDQDLKKRLPNDLKAYDKCMTSSQLKRLENYLIDDYSLCELIVKNNQEKRVEVINYLHKEINEQENNAFVDLDGSGFSQNCLASYFNKEIISFYFFSTLAILQPINVIKHCFWQAPKGDLWVPIELLTKAPHGQTLYYSDGKPILETSENIQQKWLGDEYLKGVLDFILKFYDISKLYPFICFENQLGIEEYVNYLNFNLDKRIAEKLGDIISSKTGNETCKFAPKLNLLNLIQFFFIKKFNTESFQISKQRSSMYIQIIINLYIHIKKIIKILLYNGEKNV